MSTLLVPEIETKSERFPTLGHELIEWIEEYLVYGPGVLKGEPYKVAPWVRALLRRAYEVYPPGHPLEATRRFKLVSWSLKKGSAKSELGAILSICEAHPDAPVRCDGFDANGDPVGVGVVQPFIPMFAFNLQQSEELSFSVVRSIIDDSDEHVSKAFAVFADEVRVLGEGGQERGKIIPVGSTPAARDGARTTFAFIDETHHIITPRNKRAVNISRQNLFKRSGAYGSGWQLETTTAYSPGEQSIAEETHDYAKMVANGEVSNPRLFYYHRQADDDAPLETEDDVRTALLEAAGPTSEWSSDIEGLVGHYFEPGTDRNWFRRVWLNQPVFGSGRAFDINAWREQTDATVVVPDGSLIVLGFDGARRHDATALVAMDVEQSFMWPVGIWTRPEDADDDWEMPSEEIDAAVAMMFDRYDVWRLYGDPPYWSEYLDKWAGEYSDRKGKSRVVSWWTNRKRPMAYALQSFENAIKSAAFTHDGDTTLASHISNSVRHALTIRGEDDKPLWNLRKERSDSPLKIDGAMAATLCWEAYGDCVAAGKPRSKRNRALHSF